jgi:hypothetical protein
LGFTGKKVNRNKLNKEIRVTQTRAIIFWTRATQTSVNWRNEIWVKYVQDNNRRYIILQQNKKITDIKSGYFWVSN